MSGSVRWKRLNNQFALRYELGYKYLDKCGEFMVLMEEEFDCLPGEAKPTGAKLEQPDLGIAIEVDATEVRVRQEEHGDPKEFATFIKGLSQVVLGLFDPATPIYAGIAASSYRTFDNEEQLHAATLKLQPEAHYSLANALGVSPQSQAFSHIFTSGSYEIQIEIKEVTVSGTQKKAHSPGFKPTQRAIRNAKRRNSAIKAIDVPFCDFALLLEVDLRERSPVVGDFTNHFNLLGSYESKIQQRFAQ